MPETIVIPPDCEATVRRLWEYLDGALDPILMAQVDAHIAECVHCRSHVAFERTLIAQIRGLREAHDNPVELRVRVLAALHAAGFPGP